jgi:hypothetical protein
VQLGALCEALVMFREQQDREGQEALYRDTLRLLSGGDEQVRRCLEVGCRNCVIQ